MVGVYKKSCVHHEADVEMTTLKMRGDWLSSVIIYALRTCERNTVSHFEVWPTLICTRDATGFQLPRQHLVRLKGERCCLRCKHRRFWLHGERGFLFFFVFF